MITAILVDGEFFIKRCKKIYGDLPPEGLAKKLFNLCLAHLKSEKKNDKGIKKERDQLYRIFFYDCRPYDQKQHNPVSKKAIDYKKSFVYDFRTEFHNELIKLRKVALRLGKLSAKATWLIRPEITKELLSGRKKLEDLSEGDVYLNLVQKGVDIKIGLDIASMAFKKQVSKIILISGDSDFVPAAKLARREGIDFVLDPMWQNINSDLFEHIDGLRSTCDRPKTSSVTPKSK